MEITSNQRKVLACSTGLASDAYQSQKLRHFISFIENKDALIDLAIKEGLAGLFYKNLLKSEALNVLDYDQRKKLQSLYYRTLSSNLIRIHDLKIVLYQLNKKKAPVVLMQGIALLYQVYDDIGLRPMADIDLWILKENYSYLENILFNLGFQRDPVYPDTFRKGATVFDLHTHILWADRIKARNLLLAKRQEQIYHATETINLEGREVLCLNRYDQVLYLSLHAFKHRVNRLIWLVDIKLLLADWTNSDWKALMNRAKELGQEKIVAYIAFLLKLFFDLHLAPEAYDLLEKIKLNPIEKRLLKQRIKKESLPAWSPLFLFATGKGLKKRLVFIIETLFPRSEILRQVFVDSSDLKVWQLYLKRLIQLAGMIKIF